AVGDDTRHAPGYVFTARREDGSSAGVAADPLRRTQWLLNLPLERHAGGDDGCLRHHGTVHHPYRDVTVLCMTPDQIGLAVAIDINHFGDLPGERDATGHHD